jgi:hypothetical protein
MIYAGTDEGVIISTNNGGSWSGVGIGLTPYLVHSLAVSGTNIFAGTCGSGVFLSTDGGTNWSTVNNGLANDSVWSLAISGIKLFAGTNGGIFLSTNNGTSWSAVNTGLSSTSVAALAVSGSNLFAGTQNGVWRRPLSDLVTSVGRATTEFPAHFILTQNYPNPFNPSTTINYAIPARARVTLSVFNMLGQKVAELVKDEQTAGSYSVTFDGTRLASGVYFYRLEAGSFVQTKKLILLK